MLINKSNYEFFAIDYVEGTLSVKEMKAMRAFLQAHPEIEAELESLKHNLFTFEADESIIYDNKQSLLKSTAGAAIIPMRFRTWYKMAAAAAIAILLIGFGAGYFSAYHLGKGEAIVEIKEVPIKIDPMEDQILPSEPAETAIASAVEELADQSTDHTQRDVAEQIVSPIVSETESASIAFDGSASMNTDRVEAQVVAATDAIPVDTLTEEVIADSNVETPEPLTQPELLELPKAPLAHLSSETSTAPNFERQKAAFLAKSKPFDFDRIRNWVGRLPFEDATLVAFVPTYLEGE
ncbi:MAG: hypothetical protein AAF847_07340 [Bacteroidota bacterium]